MESVAVTEWAGQGQAVRRAAGGAHHNSDRSALQAILGHHPLTCKPSFPHTLRPALHRCTAARPHRSIAGVCAAQQPRQAVLALQQGGLQQAFCTAGTAFLIQVHRMYLDLEVGKVHPARAR